MKKVIGYFLLLGLLISSACQKEETVAPADFEKGKVLIGFKDGTPIEKAFRLADSLQLPITQLNGFFYRTTLPNDSLAYIKRVLATKPYLTKNNISWADARLNVVNNTVEVLNTFFDMDAARQQDWLSTKQQLQLVPLPTTTAYAAFKVPDGQEEAWLLKLSRSSLVKWAELNEYSQISLH
jgi:hypothetical protein